MGHMTETSNPRRQSERNQALSLLKQAHRLLAERLTQAVLDLGDDLLEDARGDSFAGEIDTLHERLGIRLSQVNVLLSGLSEAPDADVAEASGPQPDREIPRTWTYKTTDQEVVSSAAARDHRPGTDTEQSVSRPTAASPRPPQTQTTSSTYPLFVQDIVRRDLPAAGHQLAEVLGMTQDEAEMCATRFRDQLDRDPGFLAKVHNLRKALQSNNLEQARQLLWECFGLHGLEAQAAMSSLKGWL